MVLAQFMAVAALEDGKFGQAFPFLGGGGERRGKPIMAFCRLDRQPIRIRCRVSAPDYIILQDATILKEENVLEGLKPTGTILVNTDQKPESLGIKGNFGILCFSADKISRNILGRPIMNTALLGAFAATTKELTLEAVLKAVRKKFSGELGDKNARVVQESYFQLTGGRK